MLKPQPNTRDREITAWMLRLEIARQRGDQKRQDEAGRELQRLGVTVRYSDPSEVKAEEVLS